MASGRGWYTIVEVWEEVRESANADGLANGKLEAFGCEAGCGFWDPWPCRLRGMPNRKPVTAPNAKPAAASNASTASERKNLVRRLRNPLPEGVQRQRQSAAADAPQNQISASLNIAVSGARGVLVGVSGCHNFPNRTGAEDNENGSPEPSSPISLV